MQLRWPPHPKDFAELPEPIQCEATEAVLELQRDDVGGLNPRLLFGSGGAATTMRRPVTSGLGRRGSRSGGRLARIGANHIANYDDNHKHIRQLNK